MEKFTITMIVSIDDRTDDYFQSQQAIEEETESWLESLRAKVHSVKVAPWRDGKGPGQEGAGTGQD